MAKNNEYTIGNNKHVNGSASGNRFGGPPKTGGGEKSKNFKKSLGKLVAYCKPWLPAIITALLMAVGAAILSLAGPNQLSRITDLITEGLVSGINLTAIGSICLALVVMYGISFILNYAQGFIMATTTQRITKKLRGNISSKINKMPLKYFDSTSNGDILSRVTNDVDTIGQTLNQSIGSIVSAVVMFLGSLIMMLIISKSQKYFSRQQNDLGKINGHIEEIYAGQHIVKAYNGEAQAKQTFQNINARMIDSGWKSQFMSGLMMPLMSFIGNLGYVAVCVVGAILAMNGSITFGVIVAFMVYIRLFTQPLSQLAQAATSLQSTAAASERVFEFLEEPELQDESHKGETLNNVQGTVVFEDIRFGYNQDNLVIKDFNAEVQAGQKIAIVGPTGAGKTTIVNLLMRFYELNDGNILIDGVPTSELTRENVHRLFSMVLQDTWLFEGTIKENIIFNKQNVQDEDVITACKAAGIHHFICTLPKGYNTVLNDNANLSEGQKQLITMARAMVQDAPLLILDEATSNVDTRTEVQIQKAMDKLMAGRTSFVIAHRLSTIKNADMILVMKDGNIIEAGTHEDLLEEKGFYSQLYNSQFEQEENMEFAS